MSRDRLGAEVNPNRRGQLLLSCRARGARGAAHARVAFRVLDDTLQNAATPEIHPAQLEASVLCLAFVSMYVCHMEHVAGLSKRFEYFFQHRKIVYFELNPNN